MLSSSPATTNNMLMNSSATSTPQQKRRSFRDRMLSTSSSSNNVNNGEEVVQQQQEINNDVLLPSLPDNNSNINNTNTNNNTPFPAMELISDEQLLQNTFLSYLYPLADLTLSGPNNEENGKYYSIALNRMDNGKLRCLKRDTEDEVFVEYHKTGLSLIFPTYEDAMQWRLAIEEHTILSPEDCLPVNPLTTEERKKLSNRSSSLMSSSKQQFQQQQQQLQQQQMTSFLLENVSPTEASILSSLVLPTSGLDANQTESIKIEIAQSMISQKK